MVPGAVSFTNTFENQSYVELVSVQNISKAPVIIRIHNPRAWVSTILIILLFVIQIVFGNFYLATTDNTRTVQVMAS